MKVECAWCGCLISGDEDDDDVSHGICIPCRDFYFPPDVEEDDDDD